MHLMLGHKSCAQTLRAMGGLQVRDRPLTPLVGLGGPNDAPSQFQKIKTLSNGLKNTEFEGKNSYNNFDFRSVIVGRIYGSHG